MDLDVDYINTDHIPDLKKFINTIPKNFYKSTKEYEIYQPTYKTDQINKKVKNVILLIPDGTSFLSIMLLLQLTKGN